MILTIINGNVLDPAAGRIIGERSIVIEGDLIVDVDEGSTVVKADIEIDARGRYVLPGFIDDHVHLSISTMNFARALRLSVSPKWSGPSPWPGWPRRQYSADSPRSGTREERSGGWSGRSSGDYAGVQE